MMETHNTRQKNQLFHVKEIGVAVSLLITFLLTRLVNLRLWPIFTDEAIYTRWSQIALHDAALRFIPLTDGKQPLWHWFTMSAMKIVEDPLIAGRMVSVASGFGAAIGIYFLANEIFSNRKAAFISTLLYILTPFTLFYDRIALVESMLSMWGIWALYLGVKTAKSLKTDNAMFTGFTLGAGLLTKSPASFFQYFYPLNLLFVGKERQKIGRWLLLTILTMAIAEGMRNIMRLSPWMHMIGRKNLEFITTFGEFFGHPTQWFWGNLPSLWRWWIGWLTWPIMTTAIAGFCLTLLPETHPLSLRKHAKGLIFLFIQAVVPFLVAAAFGKVIFARYLLFVTPPLLITAALTTDRVLTAVKRIESKTAFMLFLLIAAVVLDIKICTDPVNAPIIQADRDQYVDGFPAGWGIDEVIAMLKKEAETQKIFLGAQGTFGLMPASFELYLWDNPNIEIKGYWPVIEIPEEVRAKAAEKPTYFIYYESREDQIPLQERTELVKKFQKGRSNRFMYLFKVYSLSKEK